MINTDTNFQIFLCHQCVFLFFSCLIFVFSQIFIFFSTTWTWPFTEPCWGDWNVQTPADLAYSTQGRKKKKRKKNSTNSVLYAVACFCLAQLNSIVFRHQVLFSSLFSTAALTVGEICWSLQRNGVNWLWQGVTTSSHTYLFLIYTEVISL